MEQKRTVLHLGLALCLAIAGLAVFTGLLTCS